MQKRIYGIETEYGIIFTPEGRKTLPVEKAIRFLFEKLITTEHFLNVFLENGARFYQDTGCHPEYATPECSSPRQVAMYDRAGERILEDLQNYAEEKIREERIPGKLSIFKNNTDFVGNSYGCHENYLVDRDVDFYYLAEQLIPFLVTRQIFTGAGKVFQTQDGVHYCVSQRAQHIYQKISGTTTNDRSIINTRDEPHADREKYRRLHVIVGDSNMSGYTNFLKVATCSIVLQMIEDNFINKDFTLRNPVKAIKDITYDVTCKRKLRLDNGRECSPIDIQREYCEMAQKYCEQYPVDDEHKDAVTKWQYVLDCLADDPRKLDRQVDWVIKRRMIEAYIDKTGCSWNDPKVFMMDLQYHDIQRKRSLYYLLERAGAVEREFTDEDVEKAKDTPPPDTRARMRGEFIKLAREHSIQYDLDWSNIRLGNLLNVRVICNNPFENDIEKVAELVRTIQKTNLRKTSLSKLVIQS
ncbi:MAG: proteasome accessory factor PafA2 family protein [Myxococcales bacterium]|nr:proteasome accessory factor PafA2 family protein [Myxococcales bacterium]MCH7867721.1 proteasome accessory factor PafA2 family protein [Myxococcales bacterium]